MNLVIPWQLMVTFVPAILTLLAVAIVSVLSNINLATLTEDVTYLCGVHPFTGILSSLGNFVWCTSASVCFFSVIVLRNTKQRKNYLFLLNSALLSAYLLFDDTFSLHEKLALIYFGINEKVIYVILGIATFTYLTVFRKSILKTKYSILFLAIAFLALSVASDSFLAPWLKGLGHWQGLKWKNFIEEGAKWLGIVSWCIYYVNTSYEFIVKEFALPNKANVLGQ